MISKNFFEIEKKKKKKKNVIKFNHISGHVFTRVNNVLLTFVPLVI